MVEILTTQKIPAGAGVNKFLGSDANGNVTWKNDPGKLASEYNFAAQTPGGSLTSGAGATVTLTPVPAGVNGTDANHYLYVSGGTGTAEAVLITGGTAVAGAASGTVTFTPANNHTGAWTIRSATAGMQEAVQEIETGTGRGVVELGAGLIEIFAPTTITKRIFIKGQGQDVTLLNNNSTTLGTIKLALVDMGSFMYRSSGVNDLTIIAGGVGNTVVGTANAPGILVDGANHGTLLERITIKNHDIGVTFKDSWYGKLENFTIWFSKTYGVRVYQTGAGSGNGGSCSIRDGTISNNAATGTPTATGAGIIYENGGGLYVDAVDITSMPDGFVVRPPVNGNALYGLFHRVLGDTATNNGFLIDSSASGSAIHSMEFEGCWAGYNGAAGFRVNGDTDADSVVWKGGFIRENGTHGVMLNAGQNVRVLNTEINANSRVAHNTSSGVYVAAGVSEWQVVGCRIGNFASGQINLQKYGIEIVSGASDYYQILHNDLRDNVTGPMVNAATGVNSLVAYNTPINDRTRPDANVRDFGAKGDLRQVGDASFTSGSATVTSATAAFWNGDIGKRVVANGGGSSRSSTASGAMTATSRKITVSGLTLVGADVGKRIRVPGAGAAGVALETTIEAVTSGTVAWLTDAAVTTVTIATVIVYDAYIGTIIGVTNGTTATLNANAGATVAACMMRLASDDTAAFAAAIAAVYASGANHGGVINVPAGDYMTTSVLALTSDMKVCGAGYSTRIYSGIAANGIFSVTGSSSTAVITAVEIRDMRLYGTPGPASSQTAIAVTWGSTIRLNDLNVENFYDAIVVSGIQVMFWDRIRCRYNARYGALIQKPGSGDANNNFIYLSNVEAATNGGIGLWIKDTDGLEVSMGVITKNYDTGLYFGGGFSNCGGSVFNNMDVDHSISLISALFDHINDTVISNSWIGETFPGVGTPASNGLKMVDCHMMTVTGNQITQNTDNGLVMEGCTRCTVSNNTIWNNGNVAVWIKASSVNSTDNLFSGNIVTYAPDIFSTYTQYLGIYEDSANDDRNRYIGNVVTNNQTSQLTVKGKNSVAIGNNETGVGSSSGDRFDRAFGLNDFPVGYDFHQWGGGFRLQALATPTAPTITPQGTTGATTYTYYVVAVDRQGKRTVQSPVGTTTTGNATLTGVNFNRITWSEVTGAQTYEIIRTVGGATQGRIATGVTVFTFDDTGIAATAYAAAGRAETADMLIDGDFRVTGKPSSILDRLWYETAQLGATAVLMSAIGGLARTIASSVAATYQQNARGLWVRISATTTNAIGSILPTAYNMTRTEIDGVFETVVEIPTGLVNRRIYIGLMSATVPANESLASVHAMAFRYSTGSSDTVWQCVTSNASAQTVASSGITVAADTKYRLKIDYRGQTNIKFYINDVLVASSIATLPTTTQNLGAVHHLTSLTNTGQKDLHVGWARIDQAA